MNSDKQIMVEDLLNRINSSPFVIVTEYAGITVRQFTELRKRLRKAGSKCHVAKNSLVKRALRKVAAPGEVDLSLKGQTAIVTGEADICAAAKVLRDFAKEFSRPKLKSGIMDGKYLTPEQLNGLADLPPRPVLLAQLLGVLQAPGERLVRTLNEPGTSLARVLKAKAEQAG